jgi:phosphatidate cytidylyltransferase
MLKQRLLTAFILIALVLWVICYAEKLFVLATAVITLWGAWEWSALLGWQKKISARLVYLAVMCSLILLICGNNLELPNAWLPLSVLLWLLLAVMIFWVLMIPVIVSYPHGRWWQDSKLIQSLMGIVVLLPNFLCINYLFACKRSMVLILLALVGLADSSAYFVGRQWGKTPLLLAVSAGKTWLGLAGALLITSFVVIVLLLLSTILPSMAVSLGFSLDLRFWPFMLVLSLLTVLFSVIGDLFESMMKRNAGVKDSGCILPGHGGILDRIDGFTGAIPLFSCGCYLFFLYNKMAVGL